MTAQMFPANMQDYQHRTDNDTERFTLIDITGNFTYENWLRNPWLHCTL